MAAVTLSSGVRQALASLQATAAQQTITGLHLATGKKVNSALDNPTSFFQASGLSNRASDLGTLLDSMGQAVQTLKAADQGIQALQGLVNNAQAKAKTALAAAAPTDTKVTGNQSGATLTSTTTLSSLGFGTSDSITVTVGSGTTAKSATFSVTTTTATVGDLLTAINGTTASNGVDFGQLTADVTGGQIDLTDKGQRAVKITSNDAAGLSKLMGTSTSAVAGNDGVRQQAAADFNDLLNQITSQAADASFNGVNLLNGDSLTVNFNEDGSSKLTIAGKTFKTTSDDLKIDKASNNWASDSDIQASLDQLNNATQTLRSQSATFGSNLAIVQGRQDFTNNMINTLNDGSDLLTNADQNLEGANMLALNTRSQLSQTALSLASQADSGVLRLLG
jgi:flagellin